MKVRGVDGVNATVPVDLTAARVVCFKGEHYASKKKILREHRSTPIPTQPCRVGHDAPKDYTGTKFGRMTVIGFYSRSAGNDKGALWVVRCACGIYTTRRTKAVINPANRFDCCDECQQLLYLQRQAMRRNGLPDATWDQVCS